MRSVDQFKLDSPKKGLTVKRLKELKIIVVNFLFSSLIRSFKRLIKKEFLYLID